MKKILHIFLIIFLIISVCCLTVACFAGAKSTSDSLRVGNNSVKLNATITSKEHYVDVDEGYESDRWKVYVSYRFEGEEYSHIYYDTVTSEPEYGKVVSVGIDPNNPDELLPGGFEFVSAIIVSPLILSAISIFVGFCAKNLITTIIEKKNPKVSGSHRTSDILSVVAVLVLLVAESVAFYIWQGSFVYAVFSVIALVVTIMFMLISNRKKSKK